MMLGYIARRFIRVGSFSPGRPAWRSWRRAFRTSSDQGPTLSQDDSVLLMSGGVESAVLLSYYVHWSHAGLTYPLFIDYGQKGALEERRAAWATCKRLHVELLEMDLSSVGDFFRELQAPMRQHVPLPHRNLVLASLGASYAAQLEVGAVMLALNQEDLGSYSATSSPFLAATQSVFQMLTPPVKLVTPFQRLRKAEVVSLGEKLGVVWRDTYSCMLGAPRHCGRCTQCIARRNAFLSAGVREVPETYATPAD
eukprot:jgi/Botrbrau1/7355/Bobra.0316s0003.1